MDGIIGIIVGILIAAFIANEAISCLKKMKKTTEYGKASKPVRNELKKTK